MLRSHSKHNSEIDYFSSYLKEAQSGKPAYIDLVKPYILQMKQTDFRVSDDLYQTVLRKANEE